MPTHPKPNVRRTTYEGYVSPNGRDWRKVSAGPDRALVEKQVSGYAKTGHYAAIAQVIRTVLGTIRPKPLT